MMDINVDLCQWYINVFDKNFSGSGIKMKIFLMKNQWKNYTIQLLENLIKEQYIHLLYLEFRSSTNAIDK